MRIYRGSRGGSLPPNSLRSGIWCICRIPSTPSLVGVKAHVAAPGGHAKLLRKQRCSGSQAAGRDLRFRVRRRRVIEPVIGFLKHQFCLLHCCLKGFVGGQINLLPAASAWNLLKWSRKALYFCSLPFAFASRLLLTKKRSTFLRIDYVALITRTIHPTVSTIKWVGPKRPEAIWPAKT